MAKNQPPALPPDLAALADELPPMFGQKVVAETADVEETTVEAWRYRGVGPPFIRVTPGCVRYTRDGFLRWLAERYRATPGHGGTVPPETLA